MHPFAVDNASLRIDGIQGHGPRVASQGVGLRYGDEMLRLRPIALILEPSHCELYVPETWWGAKVAFHARKTRRKIAILRLLRKKIFWNFCVVRIFWKQYWIFNLYVKLHINATKRCNEALNIKSFLYLSNYCT